MKKILLLIIIIVGFTQLYSQKKFTNYIEVKNTPVKNQQRTGTCWSFATASFLESEILRLKNKTIDLSEMYEVRNIYEDKALNYFLRQGKTNFSEGGLAHDFIRAMAINGVVPQTVYPGNPKGETVLNHAEISSILEAYVKAIVKSRQHTDYWKEGFDAVLDVYFGKKPDNFMYDDKEFTPGSFAEYLGLNPENYIELTSFTHHPFKKYFVLEIPDNYSSGMYYNIELQKLKEQTDYALENGYSVCWDGDVSEAGFGRRTGEIDIEEDFNGVFDGNQQDYGLIANLRQSQFEQLKTTDDHLMHIVGKAKDNTGRKFYIVKNSWGNSGEHDGYYYMSEKYFLLKTISIMIHKNALMTDVKPVFYLPDAIY
jgi:bleomycin hydrolase